MTWLGEKIQWTEENNLEQLLINIIITQLKSSCDRIASINSTSISWNVLVCIISYSCAVIQIWTSQLIKNGKQFAYVFSVFAVCVCGAHVFELISSSAIFYTNPKTCFLSLKEAPNIWQAHICVAWNRFACNVTLAHRTLIVHDRHYCTSTTHVHNNKIHSQLNDWADRHKKYF